jgi:hypothetical protein
MTEKTRIVPTDTSDNFLQRALDKLEDGKSKSVIKLVALIIRELLAKQKNS